MASSFGFRRRRTRGRVQKQSRKANLGPDNTVFGPRKNRFAPRKGVFSAQQFEMDPMNGDMEKEYNKPLNPYRKKKRNRAFYGE
jgi:hypothetical protein